MDNNLYTCIPPSLSEKTLDKDSNRPRKPEHQRERERTYPWSSSGGWKKRDEPIEEERLG